MKIFAGLIALSAAQSFPSEMNRNDYFWLSAATDSMQGSGGVSQINFIRCERKVTIKGSGIGEKHVKKCHVQFESLSTRSGFSDVLSCGAEVEVEACKYCRQAPVATASRANCASTADGPQAVPFGSK